MDRAILHIDMNNFYASVECMLDPKLKDFPIAVCGDVEERHGIVLAKNYKAKAFGVSTGEAIWQAKQKCRALVIVPPHYDQYMKYSKLAKKIYERYTDKIEPYGMDEVWADVTESQNLFGTAFQIAQDIKEAVKFELGLTVSIGVSYNKIFAKLGSDMKKPDAITVITKNEFKNKIWHLPASDLLGVGRSTERKLCSIGIYTIGELAKYPVSSLQKKLGKYGTAIWKFANGLDDSEVISRDVEAIDKSVGHGITALKDLENSAEVWKFILELTQEIGHRLYIYNKKATGIAVTIKDDNLFMKQWQRKFSMPTQSPSVLAREAFNLFTHCYNWKRPIRAITVRAISLVSLNTPYQFNVFEDAEQINKAENLDKTIEELRQRFGRKIIRNACLFTNSKMPSTDNPDIIMPSGVVL